MSTKIIRGKDKNGNIYYSDTPVKSYNATLTSLVASGYIKVIVAGRVVNIVINDLKVNTNITTRQQIASGLPKPYDWGMFTVSTNSGGTIYPLLYIDIRGNLYIEGGTANVSTNHRILGNYTYIESK